ncbi:MAG: TIGR04282 family arsenosugar biosynthesis glycosyltransferase, partial [Methylococcales bacterium]
AAALHSRLLFETLDLTHKQRLCPVQLWCSPSTTHPDFKRAVHEYPVSLHCQCGKDLGERMEQAIAVNLTRFTSVLLMGCDCPSLRVQDLIDSFSALESGCEVVLGPAEDGGYVLIGMKQALPELFLNIPWGSSAVLEETRARIKSLNLPCFETRQQWDLDRPEDLKRYASFAIEEKRSPARQPK